MTLRVQILSDLHLEFDDDDGKFFVQNLPVEGDVLILAGDVLSLRQPEKALQTFRWFCERFKHVVFVPGNHEYYKVSPETAETLLQECVTHISNLHLLNPGMVCLEGIRFLGGTLWFPYSPEEVRYRSSMNDFRLIPDFVPWVHTTHTAHLNFFKHNLQRGDILITHHLPHPRSIAPEYAGSVLNRFFLAGDAASLVDYGEAQLWVHGHTHTSCDYQIAGTRVICNPRGYPHERTGFQPGRCIDVLPPNHAVHS